MLSLRVKLRLEVILEVNVLAKKVSETTAWRICHKKNSDTWQVYPPESGADGWYGLKAYQVRLLIDMIEHDVVPDKAIEKVSAVKLRKAHIKI